MLKQIDYPFMQAILVVKDATGLSLDECKTLVHNSRAYAEGADDREAFWDDLIRLE